GLGPLVFDKLEAEFAKAIMSLPATKGFEFGSGFAGTFLIGSEHNDELYVDELGRIRTRTNQSGGIQYSIFYFLQSLNIPLKKKLKYLNVLENSLASRIV
ncbi:hypothetical protein UlMin_015581, partial [Ulmus minor]